MWVLFYIEMLMVGGFLFFVGFNFYFNKFVLYVDWMLMDLNSLTFNFYFYFDWMGILFMGVVLLIGSMIMIYSGFYINYYLIRFNYMLFMFIFSMLFLILCPHPISMMLGWDGLGIISFCLILFYYSSMNSVDSAMITVMFNRFGDIGILISISMMYMFDGWNLFFYDYNMYLLLMLLLGFMTKSAQFPFMSWLTKAMAAPTPVSSLVHSSTLVTAGVYMIIRFSTLYVDFMIFLEFVSILTMFIAGLSSLMEVDIKKIIALSTLSQLGFMFYSVSIGYSLNSYIHMICHAMFKSMMFMSAGLIIHEYSDNQDIRFMGGVFNGLPFTSICFFGSSMSLCGFPFLSGFFSKDLIIELMLFKGYSFYKLIVLIFIMFLTTTYSFRMVYYLYLCNYNYVGVLKNYGDNFMGLTMFILFLMMIFMGNLLLYVLIDLNFYILLSSYMKLMIFFIIPCGYLLWLMGGTCCFFSILNFMFFYMFFVDSVYLIKSFMFNSLNLFSLLDIYWMEMYLGYSWYNGMVKFVNSINKFNVFSIYILMLFIYLFTLVFFLF